MRLPDFLIIGAAKSATTSLADQLRSHPMIGIPARKELNHFSREEHYGEGLRGYARRLSEVESFERIGEASPSYTWRHAFPACAERIANAIPDVRLVFIARHPLVRIESQWMFDVHVKRRPEASSNFAMDVSRRRELIDGSRYRWMLEPFTSRFPSSQFLFLTFEDYMADPNGVCGRVHQFLGVERRPAVAKSASNPSGRTPRWFEMLLDSRIARVAGRLLPPETRRRVRYGLRRKTPRPIWPDSLRREVADLLYDDARAYLQLAGREPDHWSLDELGDSARLPRSAERRAAGRAA